MFERLYRDAGSVFDELERRRGLDDLMDATREWHQASYPPINVWTGADAVVMTAELPGFKAAELDVKVVGLSLTLRGAPLEEMDEREYLRQERVHSAFTRTIGLPFAVEAGHIEARLEKGVLSVAMPRAEADKPRQIAVKGV